MCVLLQILFDIGRENDVRHHSATAFVTVACLSSARERPGRATKAADSLGPMVSGLVRKLLEGVRLAESGDDLYGRPGGAPQSQDKIHLIAEGVYEVSRNSPLVPLLLRAANGAAVQTLLDALAKYRGPHALEVADASCRALLVRFHINRNLDTMHD